MFVVIELNVERDSDRITRLYLYEEIPGFCVCLNSTQIFTLGSAEEHQIHLLTHESPEQIFLLGTRR